MSETWTTVAQTVRAVIRALLAPFGYLAFVLALSALSASAKLLGEEHELGFFAARLSEMLRRYPEITRRGVQAAWVGWAILLLLALSPFDPVDGDWDELVVLLLGVAVISRRLAAGR